MRMNTKKFILALISTIVILIFSMAAYADRIETFKVFPTIGICVGNGVRIREDPDTNSEITGKLFEFNRVVVLGVTAVNGEKWYEIEHTEQKGTGWVFGKYIQPLFMEEEQKEPSIKIITDLFRFIGSKPVRAMVNMGEPNSMPRQFISGDVRNFYKNLYMWDGVEAAFLNNNPVFIYIAKPGLKNSFGGIKIGSNISAVEKLLGSPDEKSDSYYKYTVNEITALSFGFSSDKKVTDITYQIYYDIEPD